MDKMEKLLLQLKGLPARLKAASADREKLRQTIILGALFIVLILASFTLIPKKQKPQKLDSAPPAAALLPSREAASAEAPAKTAKPEAIPTPPEVKLIDPFALRISVGKREEVPPALEAAPANAPKPVELKLEGIWVDARMKVAFISGQSLPVGESIGGWRVTSISKDRVILRKGSENKILIMEEK